MNGVRAGLALVGFALALLAGACKRSDPKGAAPSASIPAKIPSALPIDQQTISRVLNPRNREAYSGPTATIRGVVRVKGDPPPDQPSVLEKIPEGCTLAREMYGKLFREGPGRTVADALVTVTGYEGYVPSQRSIATVEGRGCAWSARTFAITFGERIDVVSKDKRVYVPDLMGAKMAAQLLVTPGGDPIALYAQRPGRYVLVDSMRIFATAEVLALKFSTFDVTELDGKYEIIGIPAGKVTLGVVLPSANLSVEREVVLEGNKTLELDLELLFDAKKFEASTKPPDPSSAPPASAAPAPSASGPHAP